MKMKKYYENVIEAKNDEIEMLRMQRRTLVLQSKTSNREIRWLKNELKKLLRSEEE